MTAHVAICSSAAFVSIGWVSVTSRFKNPSIAFFEWFGDLGIFCGRIVRAAFLPPFEGREFIRQIDEIGSKSMGLVVLAGAATGVVIALQTRDSLIRFGAKSFLPAIIVLS